MTACHNPPPRPGIVFEVRQRVRHHRLKSASCLVTLRTDQGDKRVVSQFFFEAI